MKSRFSKNIATLIALAASCYFAYYFLLSDNFLHTSIASIINYSSSLDLRQHLLILGLLPIYIAAMVFGTAILGVYLVSTLRQFFARNPKKLV